MFCTNCGIEMEDDAAVCRHCGVSVFKERKYCSHCGVDINQNQAICVKCGTQVRGSVTGEVSDKKIMAGIFGLLLGSLGIHKFILGYKKEGLVMLLVTLLTCGLGASVMGFIGLVEGIIYLIKTDDEFNQTYIIEKRGWF